MAQDGSAHFGTLQMQLYVFVCAESVLSFRAKKGTGVRNSVVQSGSHTHSVRRFTMNLLDIQEHTIFQVIDE